MATIEMRVGSLAQLYDALDPSPFRDRCLDPEAERYLLECAGDVPPPEALRLLIHLPESAHGNEQDAVQAVHSHFSASLRQLERRHRHRRRRDGFIRPRPVRAPGRRLQADRPGTAPRVHPLPVRSAPQPRLHR